MRSRKPNGWPRYMSDKRLKSGVAYYWAPPTKFKKRGCPIEPEALGTDYAAAKARCDDVLNPMLDAWAVGDTPTGPAPGTFDWMVAEFTGHEKFDALRPKTQRDYDKDLRLIADFKMKDGRRIGTVALMSITEAVADLIYARLSPGRVNRAQAAMRAARRAWNVVRRAYPDRVPDTNPFSKMGLAKPKGKGNVAATWDQLWRFIKAADELGWPSIGTAALIGYEWLQREVDIIGTLAWSHYRPDERPDAIKIIHAKTDQEGWFILDDEDGRPLYPELEARLADTPRRGTLIIMRDKPDPRRDVHLPFDEYFLNKRVTEIRDHAGLPKSITFTTFRHGGFTEAGDAEVSDAGIRALGRHKTAQMQLIYTKRTERQARNAARLRRSIRENK